MIGISKLYFGTIEESDRLRYRKGVHRRPVVVWNVTPACNLSCSHCYAATAGEQKMLTTAQALAVIDDLAAFQIPVILFSGVFRSFSPLPTNGWMRMSPKSAHPVPLIASWTKP